MDCVSQHTKSFLLDYFSICLETVVNPVAALGGAVGRVYKRSEADTLIEAGRIDFLCAGGDRPQLHHKLLNYSISVKLLIK